MDNIIEKTIEGRQVKIQRFGAIEGWKLLRKIMGVVGPAMGQTTTDPGMAIEVLFQKLPETELLTLLKRLTVYVWIDGKPCNFELDMAVGQFSLDVLTEVISLNYSEFFLSVRERFLGLMESVTGDQEMEMTRANPRRV